MGKQYEHFTLEERCTIARLQQAGQSIRQIAAALDRSPSSVCRELRRNHGSQVGYKPVYAEEQATARRWKGSRLERNAELRDLVLDGLRQGWSPEQVAGWLERQKGASTVSYETIYRFIYAQIRRTNDGAWRNYLPRAKYKRGWRAKAGGSPASFIKGRIPIALRPDAVQRRGTYGHWEADFMLFAAPGQAILVAHERKSRFVLLAKQPSKAAHPAADQLMAWFQALDRRACARPSPSTTAPSSPSTTSSTTNSPSEPSSAIPIAPGRRAPSRTPSAGCEDTCRARQISTPSTRAASTT